MNNTNEFLHIAKLIRDFSHRGVESVVELYIEPYIEGLRVVSRIGPLQYHGLAPLSVLLLMLEEYEQNFGSADNQSTVERDKVWGCTHCDASLKQFFDYLSQGFIRGEKNMSESYCKSCGTELHGYVMRRGIGTSVFVFIPQPEKTN